jgi:hypothetical protein
LRDPKIREIALRRSAEARRNKAAQVASVITAQLNKGNINFSLPYAKALELAIQQLNSGAVPDVVSELALKQLTSVAVKSAPVAAVQLPVVTPKRHYMKRDANKNKQWTSEQLDYLRRNYISKAQGGTIKCSRSVRKIVAHVRKTACAVMAMAASMDLCK